MRPCTFSCVLHMVLLVILSMITLQGVPQGNLGSLHAEGIEIELLPSADGAEMAAADQPQVIVLEAAPTVAKELPATVPAPQAPPAQTLMLETPNAASLGEVDPLTHAQGKVLELARIFDEARNAQQGKLDAPRLDLQLLWLEAILREVSDDVSIPLPVRLRDLRKETPAEAARPFHRRKFICRPDVKATTVENCIVLCETTRITSVRNSIVIACVSCQITGAYNSYVLAGNQGQITTVRGSIYLAGRSLGATVAEDSIAGASESVRFTSAEIPLVNSPKYRRCSNVETTALVIQPYE